MRALFFVGKVYSIGCDAVRAEYMFGDDILDVNFVKDILGGSLSIFYLYLWNKFVCLEKRIGEKCQKKLKNFSKPSFHTKIKKFFKTLFSHSVELAILWPESGSRTSILTSFCSPCAVYLLLSAMGFFISQVL